MRQFGVGLERGFVHPAGMNVKEAAVAHRAEDVETQAAGLFARRRGHFSQGLLHGALFPFTSMQADKDILVHGSFDLPSSLLPASHGTLLVILGERRGEGTIPTRSEQVYRAPTEAERMG
jgi:hypothetical protein